MNIKQIDVGGIFVDVVFKNIKNVHLSVHLPTGRVRISAPARLNTGYHPRLRNFKARLDQEATDETSGTGTRGST
jgi:hypothetical protein